MSVGTFEKKYVGAIWILAAAIMLASKAIWIKLAYRYEETGTMGLLALRMLFSLPFYSIIVLQERKKLKSVNPSLKDWGVMVILGLLGYHFASLFDFLGLRFIPAALERLILFVYPTMVVIIAAFWYKRKIKRIQVYALALTYLGLLIIFSEQFGIESNRDFWVGTFWVILAALCFATYMVGSEGPISLVGPKAFTALSMSFASLGIFTHYLLFNDFDLHTYPIEVLGLSLGMALFATVIPTFMLSIGIGMIGSGNASIIGSIGPVATIVMAHIFLGEHLTYIQILGTLVVLIGVLMISFRKT